MTHCSRLSILSIVALVLLVSTVAAEDLSQKEFGFKVGIGSATQSGSGIYSEDHSSILALGGGVFGRFFLSNGLIAIQPEALILQNGVKHPDSEYPFGDTEAEYKLTYLTVPVLVAYSFPTSGQVSPNVFAGPMVGFLMSAKRTESGNGFDEETDFKDDVKSVHFGVTFGAGISIAIGQRGKLMLDGRYDLGLSNILDDNSGESIKNRSLRLFAGYAFGIM